MRIVLEVPGLPVPQGGMRAFARGNKAYVTHKNPQGLGDYRARVSEAAAKAMNGQPPTTAGVRVVVTFHMPRPKSHYGTGKNEGVRKMNAPYIHTKRPDIDKLARSFLDAITSIIVADDSQVFSLWADKVYAEATCTKAAIEFVEAA